ncbi:hypothetical protein YK48G_10350 [Lentilactobacillus fungorum]|uniref:ABC-2 family transporter protein n=1 Tax=Lentilactobacillus fungorum TaxID=2201250 RepID=A0ABQ3VXH1_9LACO|nr:hypothetical protein [Lentilactobacillus fungorum]GHP13610.1 hypothetical protein YK48G_10350 [Lentilactobacillus fungorum]
MNYFNHEFNAMKKKMQSIILYAFFTECVFLFFFAVVGKFDESDSGSLLTRFSGIVSLSGTVTMCVVSVYGAICASKLIVNNYIGFGKNETFLLPINRSSLFYTRLIALSVIITSEEFLGVLIANIVFMTSNMFLKLVVGSLLDYWIACIQTLTIIVSMSLAIVLLSVFIGLQRSSKVATVISSVVFVVLVSNITAILSITTANLMIICAISLLLITGFIGRVFGKRIEKTDAE